jgi:hypothetical protein
VLALHGDKFVEVGARQRGGAAASAKPSAQ